MSIRRTQLNRAAALIAKKMGYVAQPDLTDDDADTPSRPPAGYFSYGWNLYQPDLPADYVGRLTLRCEGGYGAGNEPGPGWFQSYLSFRPAKSDTGSYSIKLVSSWDFPEKGRQSASATKTRFVHLAEEFDASNPQKHGCR